MNINNDDDEFLNMPVLAPASDGTSPSAASSQPPMIGPQLPPQLPSQTTMPDSSAPDSLQMNPIVKDYLAKKYNLTDFNPDARQALVDQSKPNFGDRALAALSAVGAGFQGHNAGTAGLNTLNNIVEQKQQKVKDFDASRKSALEYESEDPNSDTSKRFRATLKANFPEIASKYGDAFDNLTAADQKSVFQVAETKAKLEGVAAQRAAALELRKSNLQSRQDAADEKRKIQLSAQDDKDAKALQKHLGAGWVARSGQAGQVQGKINAAEAAEKLIDQGKTQPGGLDSRQYEELALSTNRLLSGGGGSNASARIQALVPHTFWGGTQTLNEYLSNSPKGQDWQKFTDRLADTIQREKGLALDQKRQYQIEGLGAHSRLKKSNPELYDQLLESNGIDSNMISEKGQYQKPAETKEINGKTYKKVPGGWQAVPTMTLGQQDE